MGDLWPEVTGENVYKVTLGLFGIQRGWHENTIDLDLFPHEHKAPDRLLWNRSLHCCSVIRHHTGSPKNAWISLPLASIEIAEVCSLLKAKR